MALAAFLYSVVSDKLLFLVDFHFLTVILRFHILALVFDSSRTVCYP